MDSVGTIVAKWLAGERVALGTRRTFLVAVAASFLTLGFAVRDFRGFVRPLTHAKTPPPLPGDGGGGTKWGMPLRVRQEIFMEFATAEPTARAEGAKSFPGAALEWSAEDHRGSFERQRARELAAKYRVSIEQAYLCLDEGIRERWPGPDGEPLDARTVPLNPRRKYGF